jgi:hypothetical protein
VVNWLYTDKLANGNIKEEQQQQLERQGLVSLKSTENDTKQMNFTFHAMAYGVNGLMVCVSLHALFLFPFPSPLFPVLFALCLVLSLHDFTS